jgi:hypothetical protein
MFGVISPQNFDHTDSATLAGVLATFDPINWLARSSFADKSLDTLAFQSGYAHAMYSTEGFMQDRALYSIKEARELLGGISRNGIYALLRTGELASVVIGCRRFISGTEIGALISQSTTTATPSEDPVRSRRPLQRPVELFSPIAFRPASRVPSAAEWEVERRSRASH